ncbi:MAG: HAMP domain-containing histidine kinase [Catenulispora sp.]|nr:HAMP domain-containing histidine kinase [Catenulispora sp.]
MRDQLVTIAMGAGAAAGASLLGWSALRALRGRSVQAALFASTATGALAVVAGITIASRAMFLSSHDAAVSLIVSLSGAAVTLLLVFLLGRSLARDSRTLRAELRSLGEETQTPQTQNLATAELARLADDLQSTRAKLTESRARERALEQSRRDLVSWVSHDLRTPLAGLRAMAEALEDGVAPDPGRYYTQMRQATDRLSGMVDDLFELSRIHAGTLRLTVEPVPLADLVDGVLAEARPLARAGGVELSAVVRTADPASAPTIQGDIRQLSRALANLVVNAIRYSSHPGTVRIEAAIVPDPGQNGDAASKPQAVFTVTDTCGGIPETDLPYVFDVAWRGTAARTPPAADAAVGTAAAAETLTLAAPGPGAGLGLAIVRGIAEAHSGTVSVANVDGGCRFTLRVPVSPS